MNLNLITLAFALGVAGSAALASEPKRIYLANDDHTDYLWTADAESYHAVFVDMLDYYLRLSDETANHAAPYQSRFNADGSYWLWQYERRRTPAEFERLIARIKDGHLSAPMTTLVSCYGGQPLEAVLRGMYYAGRLERRFQHRFTLAVAMENQSLPLGLASLWAGAGAKYSWRGVCGCASKLSNPVLGRRDHEIYWCTGRDGQRVLMKWHSLASGNNRSVRDPVPGRRRRIPQPLHGLVHHRTLPGARRIRLWLGCARPQDRSALSRQRGGLSVHRALPRHRAGPVHCRAPGQCVERRGFLPGL
jgi:alpha-mannosidase